MTPRFRAGRRLALAVLTFAIAAVFPSVVAADAELQRAIPGDGETVADPVTVITARYSDELIGNSNLRVLDEAGAIVATGGIDPSDARRMIARPARPLAYGRYTVRSTTITDDGHGPQRATWTFTISTPASAPPGASPSGASPSPAVSSPPSPDVMPSPSEPSPSPTAAPSDPTALTGDVVLPIIAALALVATSVGVLLRRGRTR